ncbi:hypothetical protein [Thiohalophilus thiocyanatoxydans]|uniref:hypothetical protein n=1 Tax=Thiohalophilus thiocyanatoxydans TaxID=381308 RepID=UPI0010650489|nr:hypothetical protein [Thiohalophilus thiocyanatoxydans]
MQTTIVAVGVGVVVRNNTTNGNVDKYAGQGLYRLYLLRPEAETSLISLPISGYAIIFASQEGEYRHE